MENCQPNPKILDFGCGNGITLSQYIIKEGIDYVGVDFHKPSLEYARENFGTEHARFLSSIPKNEKFDIIIYSEVLEHLENPAGILKLHSSSLKAGGFVLGSVPNGFGLTEIEKYVDQKLRLYKIIRGMWRFLGGGNKPPVKEEVPYNYESGHIQFFTLSTLEMAANEAGYELTEVRNGSVMGADLSGATILKFKTLIKLNTKIADYLPSWAAATWHFVLYIQQEKDGT